MFTDGVDVYESKGAHDNGSLMDLYFEVTFKFVSNIFDEVLFLLFKTPKLTVSPFDHGLIILSLTCKSLRMKRFIGLRRLKVNE